MPLPPGTASAPAPPAEAHTSQPQPAPTQAPVPSQAGPRYRSFDPHDPRLKQPERKVVYRYWKLGVDPEDLASAGWAVVFAHDEDPRVIEALQPLICLRREQASKQNAQRFKMCTGADGYGPGETAVAFLARHHYRMGPADPDVFPYHVLLVGQPTKIPFAFQYELDAQYSVGRLAFDRIDDYAAYARSVVAAERRARSAEKPELAFFATEHVGDDRATQLSSRGLVRGLHRAFSAKGMSPRLYQRRDATRAAAQRLLGGSDTPAILFSATHGMVFERGDARRARHQGALLCQDVPALPAPRRIEVEHYLSADDIEDDARLDGLIAFLFGCYTAGTPAQGGALGTRLPEPMRADAEFVARLPQRLLSLENGALAVIGHVDPAWSHSFWINGKAHLATFESVLGALVEGKRVGHALEYIGLTAGASAVAVQTQQSKDSQARSPEEARSFEDLLKSFVDARNYILLGDPAVRLPPLAGASRPEPSPAPSSSARGVTRSFDPALFQRR